MYTVAEVSRISSVSIRTLHHYDTIGLLKPAALTEAGYRLYDEESLARLQTILLLRELMFPLKDIKRMLDSHEFDRDAALDDQIYLLEMHKKRISRLIALARQLKNGGNDTMNFDAFDNSSYESYKKEAKERWGNTAAYAEYEKKHANSGDKGMQDAGAGLMAIITEVAAMRPLPPEDPAVAEKVRGIQKYITDNFYTCTDEIFNGLAAMYTADERMKKNIDNAAGDGAAEYVSAAIRSALAAE